jgi:hypothetical protein
MNEELKPWFLTRLSHYFNAFSKKNIEALASLVSDDVLLQDWEIEADGKEAFINANKKIFDSCNEITITRNTIFYGDILDATDGIDRSYFTFFCPISITIDGNIIQVLDLISFNKDGEICAVLAYKQ